MPFRFSLATVHRYRELLEQQALLELEKIHGEITRLRLQLVDLELLRSRQQTDGASALRKGVTAVEMEFASQYRVTLEQRMVDLNQQIADTEQRKQRQLEVYRLALQEREVIEELRNGQREIYLKDSARKEQSRIDDLFQRRRNTSE